MVAPDIKKALAEAKRLGFEWGGDWASFVDKPHLQYNYKGYGSDKVLAASAAKPAPKPASKPAAPQGDGKAIVPYPGKPLYVGAKGMVKKDIERIQRAVGAPVTGKYDKQTEAKVTRIRNARSSLQMELSVSLAGTHYSKK